jgi:hypothetical protein
MVEETSVISAQQEGNEMPIEVRVLADLRLACRRKGQELLLGVKRIDVRIVAPNGGPFRYSLGRVAADAVYRGSRKLGFD